MITAIIPIPMRYPNGYVLGSGFRKDRIDTGLSGRSIVVPQLYFYKFFSEYRNEYYHHIFASDSLIDPVGLLYGKNMYSKNKNNYGGVFVPISVKRLSSSGVNTFLFCRCIDFLLRHYRYGIPLDEVDVTNDPLQSEICANYAGVEGISEFNFRHLGRFMRDNNWLGISADQRLLMSAMTPELPERIASYVDEITRTRLYDTHLASYITDLCTYENGTAASLKDYLDSNRYDFPMDPVTMLCVSTPSYVYGHQLRPHLDIPSITKGYQEIGYTPINNEYISNMLNFRSESADPHTWSDSLMEELINMGDDYFRIIVDRNSPAPMYQSADIIGSPAPSLSLTLSNAIKNCFKQYEKVDIVKTWSEEIYILVYPTKSQYVIPYYMNLALYHLITPSLVNVKPIEQ